jgi:hypothetical protein
MLIAEFLNAYGDTVPGRRIFRLLELCRDYVAEAVRARKSAPRRAFWDLSTSPTYSELYASSRRYRFWLEVHANVRTGSPRPGFRYAFDPRMRASASSSGSGPVDWDSVVQASAAEGDMARRLLQSMHDGQLDYLRKCERASCGKWFHSTRASKRYHDRECAKRAYDQSPDGRESNRKRQRKHYTEHLSSTKKTLVKAKATKDGSK